MLRTVHHDALFGVETLLAHVGTLYQWDDRQVEVTCEGIVSAVVSRHCHDGSRAVSGQHILAYPDGNVITCEGIYGIRAGEHSRNLLVGNALSLGALLHISQIFIYCCLLFRRSELAHQLAFRSQHHECHAKDGVGASGEDGELAVCSSHLELHLRAF